MGKRSVENGVPLHPFARVHVDDPQASELLSLGIRSHLFRRGSPDRPLVVVCVGTDRSTGDAFGPLVGSRLAGAGLPGVEVYGTLDDPVHATNLHDLVTELDARKDHPLVVAVDACLGRPENVGVLSIKDEPLQPGTGVHKQLPPVGELHLIGIVNVGGFMEYFVLQSTRLSLVVKMADLAASALIQAIAWDKAALSYESLVAPTSLKD